MEGEKQVFGSIPRVKVARLLDNLKKALVDVAQIAEQEDVNVDELLEQCRYVARIARRVQRKLIGPRPMPAPGNDAMGDRPPRAPMERRGPPRSGGGGGGGGGRGGPRRFGGGGGGGGGGRGGRGGGGGGGYRSGGGYRDGGGGGGGGYRDDRGDRGGGYRDDRGDRGGGYRDR